MDFNWGPHMCSSCRSVQKCKRCFIVVGQDVDLRSLILYTELPELWSTFMTIIQMSPITEQGFTLGGAMAYLDGSVQPVGRNDFWRVMSYFLKRLNQDFIRKKKLKMAQNRNKKG